MKINQWIFYSLFLGLISCQSQEQTFIVHCTGLDAYEGDTVYLWRYGADRMTGDRDYGKAPLDFAIIRNGEVSFPERRYVAYLWNGASRQYEFLLSRKREIDVVKCSPTCNACTG